MIAKSYIEKNLRKIDHLYAASSSVQAGLLYSKMATLELCGWIEISMDEIVRRMSKRLIRDSKHQKYFEKEIVRKVHGFDYVNHFRRMLIALVGLRGVETMEMKVDPVLFHPMIAALNALKPYRDQHAHEYIKGTTLRLDAPSVTIGRFNPVYAGLVDIDSVLRRMK